MAHRKDIEMEKMSDLQTERNINSRIFIRKAPLSILSDCPGGGTDIIFLVTTLSAYISFLWLKHTVGSTDLSLPSY